MAFYTLELSPCKLEVNTSCIKECDKNVFQLLLVELHHQGGASLLDME